MLVTAPYKKHLIALFGAAFVLAAISITPALASTSHPTLPANAVVNLTGILLDNDIYLDNNNSNSLYNPNNPNSFEPNPGGDPIQDLFLGQKVQPGIHYVHTEDTEDSNNASAIDGGLGKIEVDVYVWDSSNNPLSQGAYPNATSGKVGFVFRNTATLGDAFHIKEIVFDDPTIDGTPYANDNNYDPDSPTVVNTTGIGDPAFNDPNGPNYFLSNMEIWLPGTSHGNENEYITSGGNTSGTFNNGSLSNFPYWDPFNEAGPTYDSDDNRTFSADFIADNKYDEKRISAGQSLGLIFDYTNLNGSLAVLTHKINAVRFGMHAGGLSDGLSEKLWVEMPMLATPEPGTMLLMTTGLIGMIGYGWRRKKAS